MKFWMFVIASLFSSLQALASTSSSGDEATLKFSGRMEIEADYDSTTRSYPAPSQEDILAQVNFQVSHLFGPMELGHKLGTLRGAPMGNHKIKLTGKPELVAGSNKLYSVTYNYSGTIIVEKGDATEMQIYLPINPETIYKTSLGPQRSNMVFDAKGNSISPCIDPDFPSKIEFWYFWSPAPAYPDCKLKKDVDYFQTTGKISARKDRRLKNPNYMTFPDYQALAADGSISIHMIFGKDNPKHGRNPYNPNARDSSALSYLKIVDQIKAMGFTVTTLNESQIKRTIGQNFELLPFVEEAVKTFNDGRPNLYILLFYGQTEIEYEGHREFHFYLRNAIEKADIVIYDGHSGLGKVGSIDGIIKERGNRFHFVPPKDKYQIYFFNSCSSFAYYNAQYFQRKKDPEADSRGTKMLDIAVNGLSTDWIERPDLAFVTAANEFATNNVWTSYQYIAHELDTNNLNIIVGDEDNPKKAPAKARIRHLVETR